MLLTSSVICSAVSCASLGLRSYTLIASGSTDRTAPVQILWSMWTAWEALKLCGLDLSNTTRQMMDELNPIPECLLFNEDTKGRATMTRGNMARARIAEEDARKWARDYQRHPVCAHCGANCAYRISLVARVCSGYVCILYFLGRFHSSFLLVI